MRTRRILGIGDFGTHDLRRTLATRLGDAGVPDEIIGRVLNHSPGSITGKVYNRTVNLEPMRLALEEWAMRLQAIIGQQKSLSSCEQRC
jgi:integrase